MRNPHRWRNIALAFFASGIVATPAPFLLPEAAAGDTARGLLFIYGVMALLFGGGTALFRQFEVRAQKSLLRGENIIARWRVDAVTWRDFVALNHRINQEDGVLLNELTLYPPKDVPADGIEVIVGENAAQIHDSIHALPRRGTPEITHAELNTSRVRPSYIEFLLYYPGGGQGASGVPRPPVRTALRFPVSPSALRDAERVVAYYSGGRPGKADFFHGTGDGTNPEDLSKCYSCGFETHKFVSHCPQCGGSMQSRRWSRRFGWMLFACGLFITCLIGAVIYYTAPMLLRPGVDIGDTRFGGRAGQAAFVLGIFGIVFTFGVTALVYGLWQVKTGRRSKKVVYFAVGLVVVVGLMALAL